MRKQPKHGDDQYSEQETVARREAALKRMLATPPSPHKVAAATKKLVANVRGRQKRETKRLEK